MELQDPPHDSRQRWLGMAEALAVLAGCMALILVVGALLAVFLAPRVYEFNFPLEPRRDSAMPPADFGTVLERVRALDPPGQVEVRQLRRGATLTLSGLPDNESRLHARITRVLVQAGYEEGALDIRTHLDGQALILEHAKLFFGLQSGILILVGGVAAMLRVRRAAGATVAPLPMAVLLGMGAGLIGFVCSATIGLAQQLLGWTVEEQAWLLALLKDRDSVLGLLPWIVVLVPLSEEVFFRGYFFRFLYQRAGAGLAYPISAACFSAIHFHLPGLLVYFVVGLIFAYVCRRTATLTAPVAAHITYNACALALALLN